MKGIKQSYDQYRNIKGIYYQCLGADGGVDGFKKQKVEAKKAGLKYRVLDGQFFIEVKK